MPLPRPHSNKEKESDFVSRCAGDPIMNKEYPKQNVKLAICYNIYKEYKKKHGANASWDDYVKENRINGINLLP